MGKFGTIAAACRRTFAAIAAAAAVTACNAAGGPKTSVSETDFPPPDRIVEVAAGETMAEFRQVKEVEGIRFRSIYEPSADEADHVYFRVRAGETFPLGLYAPPGRDPLATEAKLYVGQAEDLRQDGLRRPAVLGIIGENFLMLRFMGEDERFQIAKIPASQYERVMVPVENELNLRRLLIYGGRAGSRIALLYVEFVGDMSKPRVSRELSFDLAASHVVEVQGARFEIIAADSGHVRFKRLSDSAAPEPPADLVI